MNTIVVTGGAGFIGGTFVRRFIQAGACRVINLDLLTYAGNLDSLASIMACDQHVFVQGDIRDRELVTKLLRDHRPSAIVHFAAESHVDRSIGAPATFMETNVVGTQNLLECARGYWNELEGAEQAAFRLLHVSTDEVYGSLGPSGKFTEQTPYAPNSPYSASKAASDHLVRAYFHTYGLPVLISNCSNNYGPYQFPEKLIPLMILNALDGEPLPIYGDGTNVRDWLHVEDHCEAIARILANGRPGQVYNIGGDAERTNLEVVETICAIVDQLRTDPDQRPCRELITYVTDRPGHDRRYAIDASKIRNELGWCPKYDFATGMHETVQWYLRNRAWADCVTDGTYQRERLGLVSPVAALADNENQQPNGTPRSSGIASPTAVTFVEGPIDGVEFGEPPWHRDVRGWLVELFRQDEMPPRLYPAMAYVSETNPGVVRGPHQHADQTDCFAFIGPGNFELRLWDARPNSATFGNYTCRVVGVDQPCSVIVPPGVVHAYRNNGTGAGWVFNAPNRLYAGHGRRGPVDEVRYEDDVDSPYEV